MLMFLCPVHFFPCQPPMTWSDLLPIETLKIWIPKVDLPEIKGNHRKFRNLVTSYIGNFVCLSIRLSVWLSVRLSVLSVHFVWLYTYVRLILFISFCFSAPNPHPQSLTSLCLCDLCPWNNLSSVFSCTLGSLSVYFFFGLRIEIDFSIPSILFDFISLLCTFLRNYPVNLYYCEFSSNMRIVDWWISVLQACFSLFF